MVELFKYYYRGERKIFFQKDDDIEIRFLFMGVLVIGESGLEMIELNDLREDDKGKIKKIKIIQIIVMRRCILFIFTGFKNIYILKSYFEICM